MIDGFLFTDFRYTTGHKIVCFPGCFAFAAVVAVIVAAVAVFVVAVGAAAVVVVAVVAADFDGE